MKITLQKWGAKWCPPCRAADRAQTFEKFKAKHPEVSVQVHDDTEGGSKAWEKKADEAGVTNLPTVIWLAGGEELFRSNDVGIRSLEAQYEKALKKAERL